GPVLRAGRPWLAAGWRPPKAGCEAWWAEPAATCCTGTSTSVSLHPRGATATTREQTEEAERGEREGRRGFGPERFDAAEPAIAADATLGFALLPEIGGLARHGGDRLADDRWVAGCVVGDQEE